MSRKSQKNKKYSKELRITAVETYLRGEGSLREISKKFGICIKQEHNCIMRILNSWGEVPHLRGGIIEVSGNIAAYTIGELTGNSVLIHFEKALTEYSAGYQVINQEFLQHLLKEKPKLLTVNREEDLGDEGLRESKLSYHPTDFIRKYKVTIDFNRS